MRLVKMFAIFAFAATSSFAGPALAADRGIPEIAIYHAMLEANRESGWVQFREYDGRQLIYFTALQTLHCRLSEIRYSINSSALDTTFPLVDCVPAWPFSLPEDSSLDDIAISLAPGQAKTVTVQVVWNDGAESEIVTFAPCKGAGDIICAGIAAK